MLKRAVSIGLCSWPFLGCSSVAASVPNVPAELVAQCPAANPACGSQNPALTPAASASATRSEVTPPPPVNPPAPVAALTPVYNREVLKLRAQAQRRVLGDVPLIEDEQGKLVTINDVQAPAPGVAQTPLVHFVGIENEHALDHFHQALEELATGRDPDGKLRIAIYGASHTQGDLYTGYLRYYLQSRFGNGGPGFFQVAKLNAYYRTLDFKVDSTGFRVEWAQRKDAPDVGRYGLLGAAAVGQFPYARVLVTPANERDLAYAAERYELYFDKGPAAGDFKLRVDEGKAETVTGHAESVSAGYFAFQRPKGWHEIEVRPKGNGPVRLFGISVERNEPGIVIDTLGINGTRAANLLRWDEALWSEQLTRRAPELAIVAYGTNEVTDTGEAITTYTENLRQVLTRLRKALPTQSCLLVGPGDFPKGEDEVWQTRPRLLQIIDVQRRLAPEFNCGFWDTFAFMGGEGSMHRWVSVRPALGSPDHIHFTARGYVQMGMALGDALMRAYDAFHLLPDPPPASASPELNALLDR
ncbi:MAG TPA: GDSL-type esterase/lipase family protein [Polyangiaceae bacterium]|nr:GDSL-type esterase/lipase family protein [Polyangiaceae bacterium]